MLTKQDLDVLIEATESWVNKDAAGSVMGAVFGGLFMPKNDPVARAKFEAEERAIRQREENERRIRKDRAIVLQSKLIQMRDSIAADNLLASVG